jgi:hypothetical protein
MVASVEGNALAGAEGPDQRLGVAQVRPGHAEADPDPQVGVGQADQLVGASAAGELAVADVVADEGRPG